MNVSPPEHNKTAYLPEISGRLSEYRFLRLRFSGLPMIGYVNRADTIQNVRGFNSGNKTQQDHRKTPFPKYCDEYTTKHYARQWKREKTAQR
jgi:hypothetical protein